MMLDAIDRALIAATQAGLPLCSRPYARVAAQLGIPETEVRRRFARMLEIRLVRRIGAVPNHYRLGYRANGMSVWDVADAEVDRLGRAVGALPFVSHCYRRPRRLPDWPYNLFAMVHGRDHGEVEAKVAEIARLLDEAVRGHEVIYSRRILKKTGLRVRFAEERTPCSA